MNIMQRKTGQFAARTRVMGLFIAGVGLLLLGLAALLAIPQAADIAAGETSSVVPMAVKRPAPELDLADLAGRPVSLAGYLGQVVLVNNWATWCPPCRAEMPTLEAYFRAHRGEDFTLIAIDSGEPAEEVARFVDEMGLSFPVWLDQKGVALEAFNNLSLPSSYVIDRTGTIRLAWTGAIDREMLERYVTPLLGE